MRDFRFCDCLESTLGSGPTRLPIALAAPARSEVRSIVGRLVLAKIPSREPGASWVGTASRRVRRSLAPAGHTVPFERVPPPIGAGGDKILPALIPCPRRQGYRRGPQSVSTPTEFVDVLDQRPLAWSRAASTAP